MNNIEKLIENGGWRPIEEAPKDGTEVLVIEPEPYMTGGDFIDIDEHYLASFRRGLWYCCGTNQELFPTHFMPLDTPERMAKVIEFLAAELKRNRGYSFDRGSVDSALLLANKIAGGVQ